MESPLRSAVALDCFDYQQAMAALADYRSPRAHLTRLLRDKRVIRLRKGLYVFGEAWRRQALVPGMLANLVYGPSYLSLEYALSYYGLIPEHVAAFTSVATGRSRAFATPLGRFSYTRIPTAAFCRGFTRVEQDGRAFLIALPEKALADKIATDRQGPLRSCRGMAEYLLANLRIDRTALRRLSLPMLADLATRYGSRKVRTLAQAVQRLQRGAE